jgi:hypothetical protein
MLTFESRVQWSIDFTLLCDWRCKIWYAFNSYKTLPFSFSLILPRLKSPKKHQRHIQRGRKKLFFFTLSLIHDFFKWILITFHHTISFPCHNVNCECREFTISWEFCMFFFSYIERELLDVVVVVIGRLSVGWEKGDRKQFIYSSEWIEWEQNTYICCIFFIRKLGRP